MNQKVFVITGTAGTGKTTIAQYLHNQYQMPQVITHTTRAPRDGEVDNRDYYFETPASFEKNHYLEAVEYSGNRYGSSREGVERAFAKNPFVSIVLDTKGATTYAQVLGDEAVIIYLTVSNHAVLNERLVQRGDEQARIAKRLASADYVRDLVLPADLVGVAHVIVNDDLTATKRKIDELVKQVSSQNG
ncbi:guanylate kinase [Periweissella cryptocerci]|uniref:Guanylate kinase n=1 Tax=Periweissella cryptocerci TaxID=2506420 RepID=A0A4P6YUS5_9LACO|nr:AAA family ATPase [Periweissella cryptocerci]QBO36510.1 guanylate kinase [Periweissella cryptocerci]